jgi:magnesium transporter
MRKDYHIENGALIERKDGAIRVYTSPTPEEREELRESLGILEYDLDAALDPDEISRVEFDDLGQSIIWKQPYRGPDEGAFDVSSVGFFLRKHTLTIISHEEIAAFSEKEFSGVSSIYSFLIRYFFFTVKQYLTYLKAIKQTTTQIESTLTSSVENKAFLQMIELSESLIYYYNAIEANGGVLAKLLNHKDKFNFSQKQIALLDDAIIENTQCAKQANIYSNVLSGLMDARGSIINNNMNVLLRNLTIINVVFVPLNLIAGIGGMSEYSRFLDLFSFNWKTGFIVFLVANAFIAWLIWRALSRYGGPQYHQNILPDFRKFIRKARGGKEPGEK